MRGSLLQVEMLTSPTVQRLIEPVATSFAVDKLFSTLMDALIPTSTPLSPDRKRVHQRAFEVAVRYFD